MKRKSFVLAAASGVLFAAALSSTAAVAAGAKVFPRDSAPYGRTYGDWAAA